MADIPDLGELAPDEWLSQMQEVREQLLGELVEVWETCSEADPAADRLDELFEEYALPGDAGSSGPVLSVRVDGGTVVFSHSSDPDELRVTPGEHGEWKTIEPGEEPADGDDRKGDYRELSGEVLQLVPWWREGAFAAKVGNPQDFID
jgi:hypothetical protein